MIRTRILMVVALALLGCDKKGSGKQKNEAPPVPSTADKSKNAQPAIEAPKALNVEAIAKAAGTKATLQDEGVVRIGWGRTDVKTTIDGMAFPPTAGLGSWAAFAPSGGGAMVMGDTVVFEDEINPAIDAAFSRGLKITALHNHFVFDDPQVYFMHIGGQGDAEKLASGVKAMWDAIKKVRKASPKPARTFPGPTVKPGKLEAGKIGSILGHKAAVKPGGVVKVVIPRKATMNGMSFGGSMGLTTWAAFAGDDALASIDGDVAMTAREVQTVLRALRAAKINVVALHNHMIGETPAYFFVHFWGKGPAADLARGFRAVLDAQAALK